MNIVLYAPEIPQNTGNIVRTCSVTGASLTLIHPLGFSLSEKALKRAGLDYWNEVKITIYDCFEDFIREREGPLFFFTSKGKTRYTDVVYPDNASLVFGSESRGIPAQILENYRENCVTIPMISGARCLNLSNCVAIGAYEALRQRDFSFTSLLQ